jgi:pimeloyl-ACP methyl ester carboxylesterase
MSERAGGAAVQEGAVPVNGTQLYYLDTGPPTDAHPALLFIHGMCGFADVWLDQIARLSPHFRCVAYDRRGHTRSPLGEVAQRTVALHTDDAAGLIQALRLAPCVLVTSSGGARIGLDVMRRSQHLLAGAVLSEPPVLSLVPESGAAFATALRPLIEQAVAAGGPRAAVDAFFDFVCPGLWHCLDETRRDRYRDNHAELFGDLGMPRYEVSPEDLAAISVPCRVVRGDASHPVFREIAQILSANIPGAGLVEVSGSGHVTYAEQPEAFAKAVLDFALPLPTASHRRRDP